MEIYKSKFTLLQQSILRFLAVNSGRSFNALGLAKSLKVSSTAIIKSLEDIEESGLIKIKKEKRFSIEFNSDNPEAIAFKRVENLRNIYESGLFAFLFDMLPGATVILFGSYSEGNDTLRSDIDIAVIGVKEKKLTLEKYEKMLVRRIILQFYPSLKDINKNLKENILSGITLKGGIGL